MKSTSLLVLACLVSMPVFAQTLPDEINYGPYETRYRSLEREAQNAETQLRTTQDSLAEAKKFIREMLAHISQLEATISRSEGEISSLRREIPELERRISNARSEDSRVQGNLRSKQNEESSLTSRYQQTERDLRPLQDLLARKQQRLRELQSDLTQLERAEREAGSRLARAQSQAQTIDRQHIDLKNEIRQMQAELQNIESRVAAVQSQISGLEANASSVNSSLSQERAKLNALNGRVAEYESELSRLRSSGASAEDIATAERKLSASTNTRDNTAAEVRKLEAQVSAQESQIRGLTSQIEDLRRSQSSLPSRISQGESRLRQLESERAQTQAEINRYGSEVSSARSNIQNRQQQVDSYRNEIRNDELNVLRQQQLLENVGRQIETVRSEIASLNQQSRNLNAEINRNTESLRSANATIPQIEQRIRSARTEISEGQNDLSAAREDERNLTAEESRQTTILADSINRRNSAQNEMSTRLNLYNRYLSDSENLGSGQAGSGSTLGQKEGERLSSVLSKQNGVSVGQELGLAEAKYWGSVRGEIQGYELGYSMGLQSSQDISAATLDANKKAASDAELYAQTNFKPVFFEEYVQEEFKKPLIVKMAKALNKSFRASSYWNENVLETVPALTAAEFARSQQIVTPLDAAVKQNAQNVKTIEGKARRLSDPSVAFEVPVKIPFGTVTCNQVYKGLAVYKAACEGAYKGAFNNNYVTSARSSFTNFYPGQFLTEFNAANLSEREVRFESEFSSSQKVGQAEGLRIGKIEIYQTTYASVYNSFYPLELERARVKAKGNAAAELASFLKVKPLLTLAQSNLAAEDFRGGAEVSVLGKVKNVGQVALNGPVIFRVTELVNAEKVDPERVLNQAGALGLTELPALKVKILPSAKSGEKMIVRGVIELPGDLYKPARQEKFELTQVLALNPSMNLEAEYNKSPSIKGVFRRNIHFMTVSLAPVVDDLATGYKVSLSAPGESQSLVEFQTDGAETGAITVGATKELRLSYLFKDAAKGKNIELELSISFAGKVVRKEKLPLIPR